MIDNRTMRKYHEIKRQNPTILTSSALAWARSALAAWDHWDWNGDEATCEVDGFTITLTVEPDEWGECDWLGSFSDSWEPGAMSNGSESRFDSRLLKWFHPSITVEEHRAGLRDCGYSRHAAWTTARDYVRRDMGRAREPSLYILTLTATRADNVECGSASVGGYDVGDDFEESISMAADDMLSEVIEEANEYVDNLLNAAKGR